MQYLYDSVYYVLKVWVSFNNFVFSVIEFYIILTGLLWLSQWCIFSAVIIKTGKDLTDLLVFYPKILKITQKFTVEYLFIFVLETIENPIGNFVLILF